MTYGQTEDVATNFSLVPYTPEIEAQLTSIESLRFYGPKCMGCVDHQKAGILSFGTPHGNRAIYDIYFDARQAEILLARMAMLGSEQKNNSVADLAGTTCLRFGRKIDGDIITLRPTHEMLRTFLENIKSNQDEVEAFILGRAGRRDSEEEPRRTTKEEIERDAQAARVFLENYYKPDIRDVALNDVDMSVLLAAMYNNALTGGLGTQHFNARPMTPEEARHVLSEVERIGGLPEFDFINGRSLKTYFRNSAEGCVLNVTRYWDYNHVPFATVLAHAQKGNYLRMEGQDILDVRNEVTALFNQGANAKALGSTLDTMQFMAEERLLEVQEIYVAEKSGDVATARNYQLSLCGNGAVNGEVGHLIRPFTYPGFRIVK